MWEDRMIDVEKYGDALTDQRRYLRSVFTYPVEFKLFSQKVKDNRMLQNLLVFVPPFNGYLKDISLGGAAIQAEDRDGRFNVQEAEGSKVLLTLGVPHEGKVNVFAHIRWVKKEEGTSKIRMGISFKNLEHKDLMLIERLIGMKGKDYNLLWNLWEQYCSSGKTCERYSPFKSWWRKFFSDN
jgi:hypothetical protein